MIYNILLIVQILVALGIIGLVLIQHGKGADAGAAFGGGSSGTVFGSAGAGNFLSRATAILAAIFFTNSLALAWIVSHSTGEAGSLVDSVTPTPVTMKVEVPVSDVPGGVAVPQQTAPVASDVPTNDVPPAPKKPAKTDASSGQQDSSDSHSDVTVAPVSVTPTDTEASSTKVVKTPSSTTTTAVNVAIPAVESAPSVVSEKIKASPRVDDSAKIVAPIVNKSEQPVSTNSSTATGSQQKYEASSVSDVPQ